MLNDKKRKLTDKYLRDRQAIENEIAQERAREKREKERKKKQKEQQQKNNNLSGADYAYQSYVKDSMSIAEINRKLQEFLNEE